MKQFYQFVVAPFAVIMAILWAMPNLVLPVGFFYTSCAALVLCHQIIWLIAYGNKKMEGELVLKRVTKKIHYHAFVFAILYTLLYVTNPAYEHLFFPIAFGFFAAFEFGNYFLIRYRKPDALAICGQLLTLDFYYPVHRDLSELSCLKLNGFNNRVEMVFTNKPSAYFYGDEFTKDDLNAFIAAATSKSHHQVAVAGNLQHYLNTATHRVGR